MDSFGTGLMVVLLYALFLMVIVFVTRMFWLWYFKLDKIEEHLAAIRQSLAPSSAPFASARFPESAGGAVFAENVGLGFVDATSTRILFVEPGLPADKAGITSGDKIVSIGANSVSTGSQAITLLAGGPGTHVEVEVVRGEAGSSTSIKCTLTRGE